MLSAGVTGVQGGKGSGEFGPSLSDLITSGGVVAPERLQYLLWTLIGSIAFLSYTLSISPAELHDLPKIPDGFLTLSGISAAGYIGGKVARGPGPKLTRVTGTYDAVAKLLTLTAECDQLATKGSTFYLRNSALGGSTDERVSAAIDFARSTIDASGMAQKLVLTVADAPTTPWYATPPAKKLSFSIVNPDGEKAVWEFSIG